MVIFWTLKRLIIQGWIGFSNLTHATEPPPHPVSLSHINIIFSWIFKNVVIVRKCMCLRKIEKPVSKRNQRLQIVRARSITSKIMEDPYFQFPCNWKMNVNCYSKNVLSKGVKPQSKINNTQKSENFIF